MSIPPEIAGLLEESLTLERMGNIGVALLQAQQALERATDADDAEAIAASLACVARVQFRTGLYEQARALATKALSLASPHTFARADALLILGLCAAETDDPVAAEEYYHRAADASRKLGYWRVLLRALHNLSAGVYVPRGQFDLALAADKEALRLTKARDMPEHAWAPLATMGWVYWVTGQPEKAFEMAQELRNFATQGSLAEGFCLCLCADLDQDAGDLKSALSTYHQARSIAEAIGDPGLSVLLRLGISRAQRANRRAAVAQDWAEDALTIAARVGYHHLQGLALIERGRAAWELGDAGAAETDFKTAMATLTPLQANFDLARAALLLAALFHDQRRSEAMDSWLDAARRIISGGYAFLVERERTLAFPLIAAHLNDPDPTGIAICSTLLAHLERVPPPSLHISTLGRFEVQQRGRVVPAQAWRQRRAGELFRLLLVSPGRALFIDQVVEALWPDKTPASARALFHQATSALRRALEPDLPPKFPSRYVDVKEGQVALRLPPASTIDFETFVQRTKAGEHETALACYRGDPFPDDRYADWVVTHRERLIQLHLHALLAVAQERLEAGHYVDSLEACRKAIHTEPWQEQAVLIGMNACLALNDRAGAIRLYRTLERALREEVGIAPQAELQNFFQSLL